MRWLAVSILVLASVPAFADRADELVAEGQALGKQGQLDDALAKFREADRLRPRALHDCLIGLAYFRATKISEADIHMWHCRRRASAVDPLPDWLPPIEKQVTQAAEQLVLVELPALAGHDVAIAELFGGVAFSMPARLHLAEGTYHVTERDQQRTLTIERDQPPVLRDVEKPVVAPVIAHRNPSRRGSYVLIAGAGLLAAAAGIHAGVMWPRRNAISHATSMADYDDRVQSFHAARTATIGLYSAAALTLVAGALLYRADHRAPLVGVAVDQHSALVTLELRR